MFIWAEILPQESTDEGDAFRCLALSVAQGSGKSLASAHIRGYYVACLGRWGGHNPSVEFLMIWLSQ